MDVRRNRRDGMMIGIGRSNCGLLVVVNLGWVKVELDGVECEDVRGVDSCGGEEKVSGRFV